MKITVAIITRNRAGQLKRCLRSLTTQTVKSFNVLVVDNNSSDGTKEMVSSFKPKLKVKYVFEPKTGRSFARNRVLEEVNYGILATIDDDCEAFPNWVENILASHKHFFQATAIQGWMVSQPKMSLICIIVQFNYESGFRDQIICKKNFSYYFNNNFLKKPSPIMLLDTKNVSFKIDQLKKANIRFNKKWKHAEDFEFSKQLLSKQHAIIFDPRIKIYHWERSTIRQFLYQRYFAGKENMRTELSWSPDLFPQRRTLWWIGRSFGFLVYIVQKRYLLKAPLLVILFIGDKIFYITGRQFEKMGY